MQKEAIDIYPSGELTNEQVRQYIGLQAETTAAVFAALGTLDAPPLAASYSLGYTPKFIEEPSAYGIINPWLGGSYRPQNNWPCITYPLGVINFRHREETSDGLPLFQDLPIRDWNYFKDVAELHSQRDVASVIHASNTVRTIQQLGLPNDREMILAYASRLIRSYHRMYGNTSEQHVGLLLESPDAPTCCMGFDVRIDHPTLVNQLVYAVSPEGVSEGCRLHLMLY